METMAKADMMEAPSRNAAPLRTGEAMEWTERQTASLLRKHKAGILAGKSVQRIAQEVGYKTGRRRPAVVYHILRLLKKAKEEVVEN